MINSRDGNSLNASVVHIACENGDFKMIQLLKTKYNFDLDCTDKEKATPLLYAARQGNIEIV